MKKILLLICTLFCAINLAAQEHFTFRDIPITGSVEEFGEQLKAIGYSQTDNRRVFTGKFVGEDCIVYILKSDHTNVVCAVAIKLDPQSKWCSLKSDYIELSKIYSEKYGNPTSATQSFDSPYYDGDGHEISAIKNNKCDYSTKWETSIGGIAMVIDENCSITIIYADKINTDLRFQEKEKAIKDEI